MNQAFEFHGVIFAYLANRMQLACNCKNSHHLPHTLVYASENFYYKWCDSKQNDVHNNKIVLSLQPVKSNRSLKLQQILYKNAPTYLGMKKKESGEQRE